MVSRLVSISFRIFVVELGFSVLCGCEMRWQCCGPRSGSMDDFSSLFLWHGCVDLLTMGM